MSQIVDFPMSISFESAVMLAPLLSLRHASDLQLCLIDSPFRFVLLYVAIASEPLAMSSSLASLVLTSRDLNVPCLYS